MRNKKNNKLTGKNKIKKEMNINIFMFKYNKKKCYNNNEMLISNGILYHGIMMRNRVDMEGNIMAAIIGSPTRYIQGKGEMKNLCSYADKFGKNLFILTSASGRKE